MRNDPNLQIRDLLFIEGSLKLHVVWDEDHPLFIKASCPSRRPLCRPLAFPVLEAQLPPAALVPQIHIIIIITTTTNTAISWRRSTEAWAADRADPAAGEGGVITEGAPHVAAPPF